MKKLFIVTALLFGCFFATTSTAFAADDSWIFDDNSFVGHESQNPNNINEDEVFGTEYKNAHNVVSGQASDLGISKYNAIITTTSIIPVILLCGLGFAGFVAWKRVSNDKKIKIRELDIRERELAFKMEREASHEPETEVKKAPKTTSAPTSVGSDLGLASTVMANTNPSDMDGNGIPDSFENLDIPNF